MQDFTIEELRAMLAAKEKEEAEKAAAKEKARLQKLAEEKKAREDEIREVAAHLHQLRKKYAEDYGHASWTESFSFVSL